jgi:hypothetical protein
MSFLRLPRLLREEMPLPFCHSAVGNALSAAKIMLTLCLYRPPGTSPMTARHIIYSHGASETVYTSLLCCGVCTVSVTARRGVSINRSL